VAHRKTGGTTQYGRDSASKRLGVKLFAGQKTKIGSILVRQRGTKYHPGRNVKKAADDSLYALKEGIVQFTKKSRIKFNGNRKKTTFVHVLQKSNKKQ